MNPGIGEGIEQQMVGVEPEEQQDLQLRQRRRARCTAWLVAGAALLIYLLSILQGWYYS